MSANKSICFAVVLAAVVSVVLGQAQLLQNNQMNGCGSSPFGAPLTGWTGTTGGGGPALTTNNANLPVIPPVGDSCGIVVREDILNPITNSLPITYPATFSLTISAVCIGSVGTTCTAYFSTIEGFETFITFNAQPAAPQTFTTSSPVTVPVLNDGEPMGFVFSRQAPTMGFFITEISMTLAGGMIGDPHVFGLSGQIFDFVGSPHAAYCLISDTDFQLNTVLGRQRTGPHSFIAGTVMKTIAALTPLHTIIADAGGSFKNDTAFVTLDGVNVERGSTITVDNLSVTFESLDSVNAREYGIDSDDRFVGKCQIIVEGTYDITIFMIENHFNPLKPEQDSRSDYYRRFLDVRAALNDESRSPQGILGQTSRIPSQDKGRSLKDWKIVGSENDYKLNDGIIGHDFTFNKFVV